MYCHPSETARRLTAAAVGLVYAKTARSSLVGISLCEAENGTKATSEPALSLCLASSCVFERQNAGRRGSEPQQYNAPHAEFINGTRRNGRIICTSTLFSRPVFALGRTHGPLYATRANLYEILKTLNQKQHFTNNSLSLELHLT